MYKTFFNLNDSFFDSLLNNEYQNFSEKINTVVDSNIYKDNENYYAELNLAGFNKEDIKINCKDDQLIVRANKTNNKDIEYIQQSIISGEIEKKFRMSNNINVEEITSEFKKGILKIILPLKEKVKDIEIKIK